MIVSSPLVPTCALCVRRLSRLGFEVRGLGSYVQTRGKKKTALKKTSIPVRLIQDLPGYGRKGSIVPMTIGPMRNIYFPRRIADYLTFVETKNLKREGINPERDFSFGKQSRNDGAEVKDVQARLVEQSAQATATPKPIRVTLDKMKPLEAFKSLSRILPPHVVFYRIPISQPMTVNDDEQSNITPQSVKPTEGGRGPSESSHTAHMALIYGSVTTSDVATSLRALVASSEVAGRVVLGEEDIRFVHAGQTDPAQKEDIHRIKRLGDYDIEIKIKGHQEPIRRQVKVLGEDQAPVEVEHSKETVLEFAGENPIKGFADPAVVTLEAKTREAEQVVDAIAMEARNLLQEGRMSKPKVELTPAEEAEIQPRGDVSP